MGAHTLPEPLSTTQEASDYLARVLSMDRPYELYPFELGWVISPELTEEEVRQDAWVVLPQMVLDARTGVIYQFPSWAPETVMEHYLDLVRRGNPLQGHQIYPPQRRIHLLLTHDDPDLIEYEIRIESLTGTKETEPAYTLSIDPRTKRYHPPDTWSAMAATWAISCSQNNPGWPREGSLEY